ncbi:MAG: hypothetical protein P8K05_01550 [Dehalococcoidia bacterium]|nr:hypothetical protein [Dehalococcoidia bacterium]
MEFSETEDLIIKKNIIKHLYSKSKEIFPLGSFKSYDEIPLGWRNNVNIKDMSKSYKKLDDYKKFLFVGLGGSISLAKIASQINPKKILTLDTFDISEINRIREIVKSKKTAIIICSKSGITAETIVLKNIICEGFEDSTYYISDNYNFDKTKEKTFITPKDIGGRYNLSTHFGILPFYLIGFNLTKIETYLNASNLNSKKNNKNNYSLKIASFLYNKFSNGQNIINLESKIENLYILNWLEQLISESLGKEESGLLPIKNIKGYTPSLVLSNKKDFIKKDLININITEDESIFYTLNCFLYSIAILGSLLELQPFDQPNVELTKNITKQFLDTNNSLKINSREIISLSEFKNLINIHKKNKVITLLLFSTKINNFLRSNLEKLVNYYYKKEVTIIVYFSPEYIHSTGQLLKGSFKEIENFIINLHGNEDQNIPNSLYTLNTLSKNQAISDYKAMKNNNRNVLFLDTNIEEFVKLIEEIIN